MAMLPPGVRHAPINALPPAAQPGNFVNRDFSSVAPDGSSVGQAILRSQQAETRMRANAENSIPQSVVQANEYQRSLNSQISTQAHAQDVRMVHDRAEMQQASTYDPKREALAIVNRHKSEIPGLPADYLSLLGQMQQASINRGNLAGA